MLLPTPVLRSSPQDVGDVFASTFSVLKSRLGLLVVITVLPAVLTFVTVLVLIFGGGGALIFAFQNNNPGLAGGTALGLVAAAILAFVLLPLAAFKAHAMVSEATYEIGQGQNPTFKSLLENTRGFLPRFFALILLGIVVFIVIMAAFAGVVVAIVRSHSDPATAAGFAALAILAVIIVGIPLWIFFVTKLLYVVPAMAVENLGAGQGLARTWTLTRGAFWRTLGYYILAALIVQAVSGLVSMVTQLAAEPLNLQLQHASTPEAVWAILAQFTPLLALSVGLGTIVQLFTTPFLQVFITVMYLDQAQRTSDPAGVAAPSTGPVPPAQPWAPPPPAEHWTPGPTTQSGGFPPAPPPPPGANH